MACRITQHLFQTVHSVAGIFLHSEINFVKSAWKFHCQKACVAWGRVTHFFSCWEEMRMYLKTNYDSPPQVVKMQLSKVIPASEELSGVQKCPRLLYEKSCKLAYLCQVKKQTEESPWSLHVCYLGHYPHCGSMLAEVFLTYRTLLVLTSPLINSPSSFLLPFIWQEFIDQLLYIIA